MPRVSEEHKQAQRDRIEAAALRAFSARGFTGASMGDVIKESGLSAGAIYAYFKNKDELITSTASAVVSDRLAAYETLLAERPLRPPAAMAKALVAELPHEILTGGLMLEIWGAVPREPALAAVAQKQLGRIDAMMQRYLTAYLCEHGRTPEDAAAQAEVIAPALVGLVQGYMVRTAIFGEAGGEAYVRALDALVEHGLR